MAIARPDAAGKSRERLVICGIEAHVRAPQRALGPKGGVRFAASVAQQPGTLQRLLLLSGLLGGNRALVTCRMNAVKAGSSGPVMPSTPAVSEVIRPPLAQKAASSLT